MLSPLPIILPRLPPRAMWRAMRLCFCFPAIGAIGAPAEDGAGAAALGGDDGVIGACAQTGAAIARAAAIATPFKRCFMPLSSVAVLDWRIRCNGLLSRGRPSQAS